MIDFILFLLSMMPWLVWALLALILSIVTVYLWGWRGAVAAIVSCLPILGYFWGRKRQSEIDQAQRDRDALRDARYRREVDREVSDMGAQGVAEELSRWNRD